MLLAKVRAGVFMAGLVCAGMIAGCGGPGMNKISGKATLDNTPLASAELHFYPPGVEYPAFSVTTKDDGGFEAKVPSDSKMPTGMFTVTAAKYELKKGSKATIGEGVDMAQLAMSGQAVNILPRKYSSAKETPLKFEVKFPECSGNLDIKSK